MRLQLSTWPEVEAYLGRSTAIVIPVGSTEQHGPNGLVGTDAICPEVVAWGLGERLGALVAPTISVGMAQHHLGFPGSITLRPSTLIAVVRDTVASLVGHGFERLYFLNGHGGNIATLSAAFSEVYADSSLGVAGLGRDGQNRPSPRCRLFNWWDGPRVKKLSDELYGDALGSHATPSEVSLTYFAYPEAVKQAEMTPEIAPKGPIHDAADYRRRFPDGRIGSNPALASVADGKRLYEAALDDVAENFRVFAEASD